MNILVLCGDYWHPPEIARQGLDALAGREFVFDWIEDARDWTRETMMAYPLVILTKSNNVSATMSLQLTRPAGCRMKFNLPSPSM
jgi:hypothetical protein